MEEANIKINNKKIKAKKGQTILEVAEENDIEIPSLCSHSDLSPKGSCRICSVKIKGRDGFTPSCSTKIKEGMEIITNSEEIRRARKINLELLFSQHQEECQDCVWKNNCLFLELAKEYDVETTRFKNRKEKFPILKFTPMEFDTSKCINCRNCVEMCEKQGIGRLKIEDKDGFTKTVVDEDKKCIYCGQCLIHCPAGAFEATGEFEEIEKPLAEKGKTVVFQFAPAIRSSIEERFNFSSDSPITEKLVAGIKSLGADKVFDVCVGADFCTVAEAKELQERLEKNENLPMFTSCCPAWVRFVEVYYPEFIPNLTTVSSPHMILGGLIKSYWAEKENIAPEDIVVVSIMPCVSKKYEITRQEFKDNPVDLVLTTRELARLFKQKNIDINKIKGEKADNPLGEPTGAGVIYGATGGVMESALRTVYSNLTNEKPPELSFEKVRGMKEIKKAEIKINGKKIKTATINGIGPAKKILKELKENPDLFDYVEVMACPGGCIGGGGQPLPTNQKIRDKRAAALYKGDQEKEIKLAEENPVVKKLHEKYLTHKKKHKLFHTSYSDKS